jgi:hypothetical protein
MTTTDTYEDDGEIHQNHDTGPGWFLKITYIVVSLVCIYYAWTYWNWQSNYEEQQAVIRTQIEGK